MDCEWLWYSHYCFVKFLESSTNRDFQHCSLASSQLRLSGQRACSCLSTEANRLKSWCTHALNTSGKLNIWKSSLRNLLSGLEHDQLNKIWRASINGGTHKWMVYRGKSHLEMDDDWGYPHFGKPSYTKKMSSKRLRTAHSFPDPDRWDSRKACEPHLSTKDLAPWRRSGKILGEKCGKIPCLIS